MLTCFFCDLVDKGGIIMALSISRNGHLFVAGGSCLREFGDDFRIALVAAFTPSREPEALALDLNVHRRIDQCEEAMPWPHSWKPRLLSVLDPAKEGFHGLIQAK